MTASAPVRVFVVVNTANADARPVARSVVEALIESGAHISGVTEDIEALVVDEDMPELERFELLFERGHPVQRLSVLSSLPMLVDCHGSSACGPLLTMITEDVPTTVRLASLPDNPEEMERIHNAGGTVSMKRVDGDLAVSRSLGTQLTGNDLSLGGVMGMLIAFVVPWHCNPTVEDDPSVSDKNDRPCLSHRRAGWVASVLFCLRARMFWTPNPLSIDR